MVAEEVIPSRHLHFIVILGVCHSVTLRSIFLSYHLAVFSRCTVHITKIFLLFDKIYLSLMLNMRHLVLEELLHLLVFTEPGHLLALRFDTMLACIFVDDLRPELVLLLLSKLTYQVRGQRFLHIIANLPLEPGQDSHRRYPSWCSFQWLDLLGSLVCSSERRNRFWSDPSRGLPSALSPGEDLSDSSEPTSVCVPASGTPSSLSHRRKGKSSLQADPSNGDPDRLR